MGPRRRRNSPPPVAKVVSRSPRPWRRRWRARRLGGGGEGRRASEANLWAADPEGTWNVLATESRLRVRGRAGAAPSRYEKLCFVENVETDTQCAVWRCAEDRTVVVAFRGTEMHRPLDFLTDVDFRLVPFEADPETRDDADQRDHRSDASKKSRGGGGDDLIGDEGERPRAHAGFLRAYESVRARAFAAVDDAIAPPGRRGDAGPGRALARVRHGALARRRPGHVLRASPRRVRGGRAAPMHGDALQLRVAASGRSRVRGTVQRDGEGLRPRRQRRRPRPDPSRASRVPPRRARRQGREERRRAGGGGRTGGGRGESSGGDRLGDGGEARPGIGGGGGGGEGEGSASASAEEAIARLAEKLGVVGALGLDAETAADAADALAGLAPPEALAAHSRTSTTPR